MLTKSVIIVAGGKGERMGTAIPKQFMLLVGRPILQHTIEKFYLSDANIDIIVVLPENQIEYWKEICAQYSFSIPHKVVKGGAERFYSVQNGLHAVNDTDLIAIHDGVRPMISKQLIDHCFSQAELFGAVIPAVSPFETTRIGSREDSCTVSRDSIFLVQTPQVFKSQVVINAYQTHFNTNFTDDASVVESAGHSVYLVEGDSLNIKITQPKDILYCEFYLKNTD